MMFFVPIILADVTPEYSTLMPCAIGIGMIRLKMERFILSNKKMQNAVRQG